MDREELIAAYLADQLCGRQRLDFENSFLTDLELLQDIEDSAKLKAGLALLFTPSDEP